MEFVEGISNVVKKYFKQKEKYIFGVYEDSNRIFYCILHSENDGYRLVLSGCYELNDMETLGDGLENIRMLAIKQGINADKLCIILSESSVFSYQKSFPNMSRDEIKRMIGWHAEANIPFDAGTYRLAYKEEGINEDGIVYKIFAVENAEIEWWNEACREAECEAIEITVGDDSKFFNIPDSKNEYLYGDSDVVIYADDGQMANVHKGCLSGIINYAETNGVFFMEGVKSKYNFFYRQKKLIAALCGSLLMTYCGIYAYDCYQLNHLEDTIRINTRKEALVSDLLEGKEKVDNLETNINHRRGLIKKLVDERMPLRAIFAEMGTVPLEGVWFTDVQCSEGGNMILKGCAEDYGGVTELVKGLKKIPNGHFKNVEIGKIEAKNGIKNFELKVLA